MKKEDFFEVLGDLDDIFVEGANTPLKKKINWKVLGSVAACVAVVAAFGMGLLRGSDPVNEGPTISMKPVINFEGIVAEIDDDRVTLKDGRTVLITEETGFMSDPDAGRTVSEEILVGNFIQGYTKGDPGASEIVAEKIWANERRTSSGSGKRVINFEGRVVKAEQDRVTLEHGKTVRLTEDTAVTKPDGSSAHIAVGDYIQGYAENGVSEEVAAKYILVTPL